MLQHGLIVLEVERHAADIIEPLNALANPVGCLGIRNLESKAVPVHDTFFERDFHHDQCAPQVDVFGTHEDW